MEITQIKKLIQNKTHNLERHIERIATAESYYSNKNDILDAKNPLVDRMKQRDPESIIRSADNRISHPWHRLLVNQKVSYTMTIPPKFDAQDKRTNEEITKLLGDKYPKIAKDICINASNAGVAWVHVWRDEVNSFFRYGVVDSKQIIPIFSEKLGEELIGLLRVYDDYDEVGDKRTVYEYWNDTECSVYSKKKNQLLTDIVEHNIFPVYDIGTQEVVGNTHSFKHGWSEIPFIPFRNSADELGDLEMYKQLIDVYDKVYAGFVNDLDDLQEVILTITNYGGADLQELKDDMKLHKMIKLFSDGAGDRSGVDTLTIDIPVEARDKMLDITRESLFVVGQGVDPQRNIGQNNSGVALKHMYSLLELKASSFESESRQGFGKLIRFILEYSNQDRDIEITQTWTRTSINNDLEQADIVSRLAPISSKEAIAKSNPIVENWEDELSRINEENLEDYRMEDDYRREEDTVEDDEQ